MNWLVATILVVGAAALLWHYRKFKRELEDIADSQLGLSDFDKDVPAEAAARTYSLVLDHPQEYKSRSRRALDSNAEAIEWARAYAKEKQANYFVLFRGKEQLLREVAPDQPYTIYFIKLVSPEHQAYDFAGREQDRFRSDKDAKAWALARRDTIGAAGVRLHRGFNQINHTAEADLLGPDIAEAKSLAGSPLRFLKAGVALFFSLFGVLGLFSLAAQAGFEWHAFIRSLVEAYRSLVFPIYGVLLTWTQEALAHLGFRVRLHLSILDKDIITCMAFAIGASNTESAIRYGSFLSLDLARAVPILFRNSLFSFLTLPFWLKDDATFEKDGKIWHVPRLNTAQASPVASTLLGRLIAKNVRNIRSALKTLDSVPLVYFILLLFYPREFPAPGWMRLWIAIAFGVLVLTSIYTSFALSPRNVNWDEVRKWLWPAWIVFAILCLPIIVSQLAVVLCVVLAGALIAPFIAWRTVTTTTALFAALLLGNWLVVGHHL